MNGLYWWTGGYFGMLTACLLIVFAWHAVYPPEPPLERVLVTTPPDYRRMAEDLDRSERGRLLAESDSAQLAAELIELKVQRDVYRRELLRLVPPAEPAVIPPQSVPVAPEVP